MFDDYFRNYGLIAIFIIISVVVPTSMLTLSFLASRVGIRPAPPPDPVKSSTYECGMEALGGRWNRVNFHYYTYALLFVVFDVQAVFVFPWAVRFNQLPLFGLLEMLAFIGILLVGWGYAWRKRDLEWG